MWFSSFRYILPIPVYLECCGYPSRWIYQPIVNFNHANPNILIVNRINDIIFAKLALQNRIAQT